MVHNVTVLQYCTHLSDPPEHPVVPGCKLAGVAATNIGHPTADAAPHGIRAIANASASLATSVPSWRRRIQALRSWRRRHCADGAAAADDGAAAAAP